MKKTHWLANCLSPQLANRAFKALATGGKAGAVPIVACERFSSSKSSQILIGNENAAILNFRYRIWIAS